MIPGYVVPVKNLTLFMSDRVIPDYLMPVANLFCICVIVILGCFTCVKSNSMVG